MTAAISRTVRAGLARALPSALLLIALPGLLAPHRAAAHESPWNVTTLGLVRHVPAMDAVAPIRDIVYDTGSETPSTLDLYPPPGLKAGDLRPAVIFVNGVGTQPENPFHRWAIYQDWCRAVAAEGMVGIVYAAPSGRTPESLRRLVAFLAREGRSLGVDPDRLGLFACSANVGTGLPYAMSNDTPGLRCAVFYYGNAAVDSLRTDLPVYYVKSQKDGAQLNQGIDGIWERARAASLPWTMVVGRGLPHAFDALDLSEPSRVIVRQTLEFWRAHLDGEPPSVVASPQREVNRHIYGQEHADAARLLEQEAARDTTDPDVERLLLLSYRNLNDPARGVPLAEKLLRRRPDDPGLRTSYGSLLLAASRPADALKQLEKAAELGAMDFTTWHLLIIAGLAADRPDVAITHGTRAVDLFPTITVMRYNLACAYARRGDVDQALSALETAVQNGFRDRATLESDTDLESLRQSPRYRSLLESMTR